MSREGFWKVGFTGISGDGLGILVFDSGMVIGAGLGGGTYDGTYRVDPATDGFHFKVKCTAGKGGLQLVQGGPALKPGESFDIRGVLVHGAATTQLVTDLGPPVHAVFTKLRDFPPGA
jgi:hypothetical protein